MKVVVLVTFIHLSAFVGFAQNLVPNGSFEGVDQQFCGIMAYGDFDASVANWYSPSQGTPDLNSTSIDPSCFNFQPNSSYSGPIGLKGPQLPRTGENLAGIFLYTIAGFEQREYLQIQLSSPLSIGGKYVVECYLSLSDSTEFATDDVGMYLSNQSLLLANNGVLNYTPQVQASSVVSDIHNWIRIADTLVASQASQYLTIGNFKADAQTTLVPNPLSNTKPGMYGSYVFVDDVRVERIIDGGVGLEELSAEGKKLLRITDVMGRTTVEQVNVPLLYIYTDGSVERKCRME